MGASFETFSTAIRNSIPALSFRDLVAQVGGHELFLQTLYSTTTPPVAFVSQQSRFSNNHGRGNSRGGNSRGFSNSGRGRGGHRPPHCQLCRNNRHYASSCPNLHTYANNTPVNDSNLAQALTSQCHVNNGSPNWYVDSWATTHMTPSTQNISQTAPHMGNMQVLFGNGNHLLVS